MARPAGRPQHRVEADLTGQRPGKRGLVPAVHPGDAPCLYTTTIRTRLYNLDESPWRDYYGRPRR